MPSKIFKELSQPANDNNKQLTMHETRNQNFLLVCMFQLGEMSVNELKKAKNKQTKKQTTKKQATTTTK